MKRRHFIAAVGAAALAILTGCKTDSPPGEKFVGYWQGQAKGKRPPDLIHIARNGESGFLFTLTGFDALFGGGYKSRTAPAVISDSANMLIVAQTLNVAYDEDADQLVSDQLRATRITESQYQAALATK
jgi:hypothetical protein